MKKNLLIISFLSFCAPVKNWCMFTVTKPPIRKPSSITTCAQNACYINSAIQAFYAISSLRTLFLAHENPFFDFPDASPGDQLPFLFVETVKALADPTNNQEAIAKFQKQAALLLSQLTDRNIGEQQDVSELMLPFLQSFRKQTEILNDDNSLKNPLLNLFPALFERKEIVYQITPDYAWEEDLGEEDHSAELVFSLGIDEDLKNIPTDTPKLSNQAIEEFLNPLYTERGVRIGEQIIPLKTTRINRYFKAAPQFIIFHIKRWQQADPITNIATKDDRSVKIPKELNLKFMVKAYPKHKLNYQLQAAVHHSGEVGGGHYITYANYNNAWWYCSDSIIKKSGDIKTIKKELEKSYIFIYELAKKTTPITPPSVPHRPEPTRPPSEDTTKLENDLLKLTKNLEDILRLTR